MTARTGPPGKDRALGLASEGAEDERLGGGRSGLTVAEPPEIPRCEAAGILCQVLGVLQREAAGRARMCCRHYLDADQVA